MFKPDNNPYMADADDLHLLKRTKKHPVTERDLRFIFNGNSPYIRVLKVVRTKEPFGLFDLIKIVTRDYSLYKQKDEFVGDLFDISHSHKIVAVTNPWNLYVEETEDGMLIDADVIDAIVGRI